jgi:CheY-like chemotaxis protein
MEKQKALVVDDQEERHDLFKRKYPDVELTFAFSSKQAISLLHKNEYDIVFLDHDLGGDDTGVKVAEWMKLFKVHSFVIIHSLNPVGALNIQRILPSAKIVPGIFLP